MFITYVVTWIQRLDNTAGSELPVLLSQLYFNYFGVWRSSFDIAILGTVCRVTCIYGLLELLLGVRFSQICDDFIISYKKY